MKGPMRVLVGALCLALLAGSATGAYRVPERLLYDLRWMGIKAGSSMLAITNDGEDGFRIVSTARSADWVTLFYPVEDRVESLMGGGSVSTMYPLDYSLNTREGKRVKRRQVIFRRAEGKALFIDHLKGVEKEFDIPERIFDPLSVLYRVRELELVVGKPAFVAVFDSKRVWDVEVKVLKKERVKVPAGTFNTVLIKPLMKSEGIFSRKGAMYIWLTDDERRIPVRLKTKVSLGYIVAELVGGEF